MMDFISSGGAAGIVMFAVGLAMYIFGLRTLAQSTRESKELSEKYAAWKSDMLYGARVFDEFTATWNFGAHEEAAEIMRDYIATCEAREIETRCLNDEAARRAT